MGPPMVEKLSNLAERFLQKEDLSFNQVWKLQLIMAVKWDSFSGLYKVKHAISFLLYDRYCFITIALGVSNRN